MKITYASFWIALLCVLNSPAYAWDRLELISISQGSQLNPSTNSIDHLVIENPASCGISWWVADRHGHTEFYVADGYYAYIFLDNGWLDFTKGVTYSNPTAWPYLSPNRSSMSITGIGPGYMSLYPDSYFRFNELTLNGNGGIISAQLEIYQHGIASAPFYGDGEEWLLLDYHRPDTDSVVQLTSLVPEPSSTALTILGLSGLVIRQRRRGR